MTIPGTWRTGRVCVVMMSAGSATDQYPRLEPPIGMEPQARAMFCPTLVLMNQSSYSFFISAAMAR